MNVAYLLVTTAWLAGAEPQAQPEAKPAAQPAPAAAVVTAPNGSCASCNTCSTCGSESGHGSFGSRLRDALSNLFSSRHNSCDTCNTCATPAPTCCAPAPKPVCCAPAPKPVCCPAPAPTCNTCDTGCGHGESWGNRLFGRLRDLFGGHHSSCDSCNTCAAPAASCCGATVVAPKMGEPIPAPVDPAKKMPTGGEKTTPPPAKGVGITPPIAPFPVPTPALEAAPSIVNPPAIGDQKRDF